MQRDVCYIKTFYKEDFEDDTMLQLNEDIVFDQVSPEMLSLWTSCFAAHERGTNVSAFDPRVCKVDESNTMHDCANLHSWLVIL